MSHSLDKLRDRIAKGSIFDVASERGVKPEEILLDADVVVMLDQSYSMEDRDGGGQTRHQRAVAALEQIQRTFPGRVVLVTFSDFAEFRLNGIPTGPNGGTNMAAGLEMAHQLDGMDMRFFLVSDGQPTCGDALVYDWAKRFTDPINTIFIGSDFDAAGQQVMKEVSRLSGGLASGRIEPQMLGSQVIGMLTAGGGQ